MCNVVLCLLAVSAWPHEERTPAGDPPEELTPDERAASFQGDYYAAAGVRREQMKRCRAILQRRIDGDEQLSDDHLELAIYWVRDYRDVESVNRLMKLLSFDAYYKRFTSCVTPERANSPEFRYPAVDALIRIGLPAAKACAWVSSRTSDPDERRRMYYVVAEVCGPELGRELMQSTVTHAMKGGRGGSVTEDGTPVRAVWAQKAVAEYDDVYPPAGGADGRREAGRAAGGRGSLTVLSPTSPAPAA